MKKIISLIALGLALGVGTARNASVIREVTKRWC